MDPPLDLDSLLHDESAHVEWKRNVADVRDVTRTLVAFANDVGETSRGGHVVCGVEETRDEHGQKQPRLVGLEAPRLEEVRGRVTTACLDSVYPALTPQVTLAPVPGSSRRVLVFHVRTTGRLHETHFKGEGSKFWIRVDDHTKEAREGVLRELLRRKRGEVPFLDLPCPGARLNQVSKLALEEFVREANLPRPADDYLDPDVPFAEGARPLIVSRELPAGHSEPVPTNLAIVLFGSRPTERITGAYARFSVYPGSDRATDHSYLADVFGPAPKIVRDLLGALQPYTGTEIDKTVTVLEGRQNRDRYSRIALQEAIVNAIAHRDYEDPEPVRVTVFSDRIEVSSPGPAMPGIDFSRPSAPKWRNPGLATFLQKLQLAQSLGQGVPKIIAETQRVAERPPLFEAGVASVLVTIPAYVPSRPSPLPPSPRPSPPRGKPVETREGLVLISIGGQSIRPMVDASLPGLGLENLPTVLELAWPDYLDTSPEGWTVVAKRLRNAIAQIVDEPSLSRLHLFYRGPIALPPLIGALIAEAKQLSVYHHDSGSYSFAYNLDRRFLKSRD